MVVQGGIRRRLGRQVPGPRPGGHLASGLWCRSVATHPGVGSWTTPPGDIMFYYNNMVLYYSIMLSYVIDIYRLYRIIVIDVIVYCDIIWYTILCYCFAIVYYIFMII
jgi:hypothetical protein